MAATSTPHGTATGTATHAGTARPVVAAGVLMMLVGAFHIAQGVVALANDTFFEMGKSYWFQWDLTAWAWVHIVAGAAVALTGVFLVRGAGWAYSAGMVLASLSVIASFLWMPHFPAWSFVVLALDVFVLWGISTNRPRHVTHEDVDEMPEGYHTPPPPMTGW